MTFNLSSINKAIVVAVIAALEVVLREAFSVDISGYQADLVNLIMLALVWAIPNRPAA